MPNNKVEVKLVVDGHTHKYECEYGKYFSLDIKNEFPNVLYCRYYLDKEYKNYWRTEPITSNLTLYVKLFRKPSEELIRKVKKDFFNKYNHELRGECFMQINNDIFIISYSDILDFDSEYAVRNGIISNVRLSDVSFVFPYEKSSIALWSDGEFYFNKEIDNKLNYYDAISLLQDYNAENGYFKFSMEEKTIFSVEINKDMYTVVNKGSEDYQKLGTLFETDKLVSYYNICNFDGQLLLEDKIVFKIRNISETGNVISLEIYKCFDDSNVDEEMFYEELNKLYFVEFVLRWRPPTPVPYTVITLS